MEYIEECEAAQKAADEKKRAMWIATLTGATPEIAKKALETGDWSEVEKAKKELAERAGKIKIVTFKQ